MRIFILLVWLIAHQTAAAEVFKCVGKLGKVIYQSQPCEAAIKAQQLDISESPGDESKAQANLDAVRNEYETRKAAQQQAEKDAAEQRAKEAQLEYARRSAIAQQEQAEAQRLQAEALERRANESNRPLFMLPPHSTSTYSPTLPHHRSHPDHQQRWSLDNDKMGR